MAIELTNWTTIKLLGENSVRAYQTDNGTLFCMTVSNHGSKYSADKLFALLEQREVAVIMPSNVQVQFHQFHAITHGNALFFIAQKTIEETHVTIKTMIYKAELNTSGVVHVSEYRELFLNRETPFGKGLIRKLCDQKTFVYRLCDDPEKDAILLQPGRDINSLRKIQKGLAIYVKQTTSEKNQPSVRKCEEGGFEIEIPGYVWDEFNQPMLCCEDSPFFYFAVGATLYALDTRTMTFLTPLNGSVVSIVGIVKGQLMVIKCSNQYNRLMNSLQSASLPDGYFESELEISKNKELKKIIDRLEKVEIIQKSWSLEEVKSKLENAQLEFSREKEMLIQKIFDLERTITTLKTEKLTNADGDNNAINELIAENDQMKLEIESMKAMLIQSKVWALQSVKNTLKFVDSSNLNKPLVCSQLENGTTVYFDNAKPFELFMMNEDAHINADLKLLDGEYDCTLRGTIGSHAYFSTIRGKIIKFFRASVGEEKINFEQINELDTSEISLFKNEPLYFVEDSKKWIVYKYDENFEEVEGEKFDISEIDRLSKYERHYHRGVLFLFRYTKHAKVEKVNDKVVRIEGPLLDETSFYTPPHSENIYILNQDQNVLLILTTVDLSVSQQCYEPPAGANNHSIVGIHDGTITMAFDGVWGRQLSTTKMN